MTRSDIPFIKLVSLLILSFKTGALPHDKFN